MTRLLVSVVLAGLVSGCVINSDKYQRPRDLADSWLVDRPRLLGIAPEPPEARPGDTVTFSALLADPDDEIGSILWLLCDSEAGCELDADLGPGSTPDELRDAGVIGYEPFLQPEWTVPTDALEGMDAYEREKGLQFLVQVVGLPAETDTDAEFDLRSVEAGFKRLVVSEALTPNANPVIQEIVIGDQTVPLGSVVEVEPGSEYQLGVQLTAESVETYIYINSDREVEERVEEPYVTIYTTDGRITEQYGLSLMTSSDPATLSGRWIAPDDETEGSAWLVVRDRRGGAVWAELQWRVR